MAKHAKTKIQRRVDFSSFRPVFEFVFPPKFKDGSLFDPSLNFGCKVHECFFHWWTPSGHRLFNTRGPHEYTCYEAHDYIGDLTMRKLEGTFDEAIIEQKARQMAWLKRRTGDAASGWKVKKRFRRAAWQWLCVLQNAILLFIVIVRVIVDTKSLDSISPSSIRSCLQEWCGM